MGKKSPSGDGDGEISPPSKLTGTGTGIFLPRGDGYGKITPDGEIPITISNRGGARSVPASQRGGATKHVQPAQDLGESSTQPQEQKMG